MAETTGLNSTDWVTSGAGSTRLLVVGMTREDGELRADELYRVAAQCGFTGEQVRSCLRRMVAEGFFERAGSGRSAIYRTTETGRVQHAERITTLRRAYQQDLGAAPWHGTWHLVAFAIPETRREARDAFRDRLIELGGASLQGGLYVSPHAWEDSVAAAAKRFGIEAHVTTATTRDLEVSGVREPRVIARSLWPVEALGQRYRVFADTYREVPVALEQLLANGETIDDADIVPGAFAMARVWADAAELDPLLPIELLPVTWPGREARELLLRSRALALAVRRESGPLSLFSTFDDTVQRHRRPASGGRP